MPNYSLTNKHPLSPESAWKSWLVCLSAGLFFFYEFFQLNLFDVINQPLRDEFHLNATQISWMSSSYVWANVLFLLPAGIFLDKYSPKRLILLALLLCVVGTIGFALSHSFVYTFWFHAATGVGNAFCFLSCVVLVSRWFQPKQQAFVIGCIVTMAFIGGMVAHTPLAYLNQTFGWRHALLIDGVVGIFILIWIVFTVKDKPNTSLVDTSSIIRKEKTDFLSVLGDLQNWLAGLYTACLNLPIMVFCALWGVTYLKVVHQLNQLSASNVVSLIFIGSIVGCPFVGWLSDYLNAPKKIMLLGALLSGVSLLFIVVGQDYSEITLGALFFLVGFFTSTQIISYALIAQNNHLGQAGAATGVASVIVMGGGGAGQLLFGWLLQYHANSIQKVYQVSDFQFAIWMFPLAIVVALIALVFIVQKKACE